MAMEGKVCEWSEVAKWERWENSEVARSERWASDEVAFCEKVAEKCAEQVGWYLRTKLCCIAPGM